MLAAVGILALVLTACTGVGGGQLPPSTGFTGPASFGFTFSCEDKGGLNPPTGKLSIQLAYAERGTYSYIGSTVIGSSFSIHGIVDQLDPVVESAVCIGQNPPPVPGTLTFLGRYRLTSSAPAGFPSTCPTRETKTTPLCRFEVTVQDNDQVARPMWHAGGTAGEASGSDLPTAAIARVQGEAPSPTTTCLVGKPGGLAAGVAGDSNFGHASCEGLVTAGPGRRA